MDQETRDRPDHRAAALHLRSHSPPLAGRRLGWLWRVWRFASRLCRLHQLPDVGCLLLFYLCCETESPSVSPSPYFRHPLLSILLPPLAIDQKNADGAMYDSVMGKELTQYSHVVAIKTSGQVYLYDTVRSGESRSISGALPPPPKKKNGCLEMGGALRPALP